MTPFREAMTPFRDWRYWALVVGGSASADIVHCGHFLIGSVVVGLVVGAAYFTTPRSP